MNRLPPMVVLLICAVLAGLITTIPGYDYGIDSTTLETIPAVHRTIESSFLANDFITNANDVYTPRFYFMSLLVTVSSIIPLDIGYFVLSILTNIAISLVTGLAARDLAKKSLTAGVLAIVIVAFARYWGPGGAATIHKTPMLSATLATPFALGALWLGIRQRYIVAMILAGLATLIHSLTGLGIGGILIVAFVMSKGYVSGWRSVLTERRFLIGIGSGTIILGIFAAFMLLPYWAVNESIDCQQFVDIYGYFRNSHHIIPSAFALAEYLNLLLFVPTLILAWLWWRKYSDNALIETTMLPAIVGVIVLLLIGGYVFVEIIPTRLWATFQAFRFVFVIRWLGFVLIAMNIGMWFDREGWVSQRARLLLIGAISPLTILVTHLLVRDEDINERSDSQRLRLQVFAVIGLVVITLVIVVFNQNLQQQDSSSTILSRNISAFGRQIILNGLFIGLFVFNYSMNYRLPRRLVAVGAVIGLVIGLGVWAVRPAFAERLISVAEARITPIISLEDLTGDQYVVADYARENTPIDAIFIVPPRWAHFRITAERAIVVDFAMYSLIETHMVEWQQRLFNVYGETHEWGWDNATVMEENYHHITDGDLLRLQDDYGAMIAVLFADTETDFPVVFEAGEYELVELTAANADDGE